MKANEAPEKLYLDATSKCGDIIFTIKNNDTDVEYTRTDAFIEKACEWLYDNLQTVRDVKTPSAHHVESIPALGIITQTEFVEKFKKEIKFLLD